MILTPTQEILARNAVQRILLAQIQRLEGGGIASIALPYDEAQCLCAAAGPALDIPADALDLGPFVAPRESSFESCLAGSDLAV